MTRTKLTIEIVRLVIDVYPASWSAKEIASALQTPLRTVSRALADLTESRLLDKKYSTYSLPLELVNNIYNAQTAVRQELKKQIKIHTGDKNAQTKNNHRRTVAHL